MTSMERVLTTLQHKEPDKVPMFLFPNMHGAKELNLSIKDFFSKAKNVVEGQLIILEKYKNDCVSNFFYASIEIEAWGGEVIFSEDGPPNSGIPFIKNYSDIEEMQLPVIKNSPSLNKVLITTQLLKEKVGDEIPIIGVVISPYSVPVMQMGFDKYIYLMHEEPELFNHLMNINEKFCVDWANAQLEAGATAICYFDPVSSPTITSKEMFLKTGLPIAKRTVAQIKGATVIHLASGRSIPLVDDITNTGIGGMSASSLEDLGEMKASCSGKITVIGNLNGIEMRRWTTEQAKQKVKDCIQNAGKGGGFILSDNHGEIPYQVPDEVLTAISEAVQEYGKYPLTWIDNDRR